MVVVFVIIVCNIWRLVMFVINLIQSLDYILEAPARCGSKWYGSVLIDITVCF